MEVGPLKEGYKVELPQPKNPILPRQALRCICLAPSGQGKTNLLVTLLTDARFYRNLFTKIIWCSPTSRVDPSLDVLRSYVASHLDQDPEEAFQESINVEFLQEQVSKQRKVMEHLKRTQAKQKGFHLLIVLDDLADVKRGLPAISKFVDGLFVKGRHWGVSIILSTQKMKLPLISPTCRVNATCMFVFRLRNQSDLWESFIYELSALVGKQKLHDAYMSAVSIPYNFLYVNLLAKDVDSMFYSGFSKRFIMSNGSDD